jgi:hypothetical protein
VGLPSFIAMFTKSFHRNLFCARWNRYNPPVHKILSLDPILCQMKPVHNTHILFMIWYLLTAIGLSPGGSTHLHTNNVWNNTNNNRTTQIQTNVEECGPCPVFASFTLAFALQLRKKHRKTSVRVRKTSVRLSKTSVKVQYTYYQKHPHITKPSQTHILQNPLIRTHTHTHTLQNNIKLSQYKLKRNAYRKSNIMGRKNST